MNSQSKDYSKEKIVIPLFETVILPKTRSRLSIDKKTGENLLAEIEKSGSTWAVGLSVKSGTDNPELTEDDFEKTGSLLKISSVQPSDEGYTINSEAVKRVKAEDIHKKDGDYYTDFRISDDLRDIDDDTEEKLLLAIKEIINELGMYFKGSANFIGQIYEMDDLDLIIAYVMPLMPVKQEEKQRLIETLSVRERCFRFIDILNRQKGSLEIQAELAKKVSENNSKSNREAILREQLKAIQAELNDEDNSGQEGYRERVKNSDMPDEVKKKALSEVKKLETGGNHNPEGHVIRNYLDLLLELPWKAVKGHDIDVEKARNTLDENHYGLESVKERIIQHLAVMKLKSERQGSILLLTGPPGTGKTSLGKSIADSLGREYVRASLGGVRDEAEVRGHRRTYVGALPGRIIQGIRKAGTKNPVFILDEIDKLSMSHTGDPSSALLEVLDPEQNSTFSDNYLEVPYDLSDVFFIATANSVANIPHPLLDRLEMIEISGYTANEKFSIAKKHLLPETLDEHGLDGGKMLIEDEALRMIIGRYTREAGVRLLKKQLAKTARHVSEKVVSGKVDLPYVIKTDMLHEILGKELIRQDEIRKENTPGVVTGLAWTPVGGDILFIEGIFMPGKGGLKLTGQLGDVMKESAEISLSLIRSEFADMPDGFDFSSKDIHIHVPSGATPKDGPSAGVTLFTALASLVTGKAVNPKLAMTGEITLSGAVLPVGGIKEKVLAAHRAGIKKIILPVENERDLDDIPEDVMAEMEFVTVRNIEGVLKEALDIELPKKPELHHNNPCEVFVSTE